MSDDLDLLRRYAADRSDAAFRELVRRNLALVFNAALRRLDGDAHAAEDVAQIVFTDLARHAATLCRHPHLSGWLFTSTHFAATKRIRTEARRRQREQEALIMNEPTPGSPSTPDWAQLRPVIDEALLTLKDADREVILLRFFQGRKLAEVGHSLGLREDAARMRLDRALARLRDALAAHRITSTSAAIGLALVSHPLHAAPAGLAATVSNSVLAGNLAAGSGATLLHLMASTKFYAGIVGTIALMGAGVLIFQYRGNAALAGEIENLRGRSPSPTSPPVRSREFSGEISPTSSASAATVTASSTPPGEMQLLSTWKNAGSATPAAFMETFLWSIKEMDVDTFVANSGGIDAPGREMAEAYFVTLPAETRARYGTSERLIARLLMRAFRIRPIAGFQITDVEMLGPNEANVHVRLRLADGTEQVTENGNLHRTPEGWRSDPLPAMNVDKMLSGDRWVLKYEGLPSPTIKPSGKQP